MWVCYGLWWLFVWLCLLLLDWLVALLLGGWLLLSACCRCAAFVNCLAIALFGSVFVWAFCGFCVPLSDACRLFSMIYGYWLVVLFVMMFCCLLVVCFVIVLLVGDADFGCGWC